mgnify:CR=1 FL=1
MTFFSLLLSMGRDIGMQLMLRGSIMRGNVHVVTGTGRAYKPSGY